MWYAECMLRTLHEISYRGPIDDVSKNDSKQQFLNSIEDIEIPDSCFEQGKKEKTKDGWDIVRMRKGLKLYRSEGELHGSYGEEAVRLAVDKASWFSDFQGASVYLRDRRQLSEYKVDEDILLLDTGSTENYKKLVKMLSDLEIFNEGVILVDDVSMRTSRNPFSDIPWAIQICKSICEKFNLHGTIWNPTERQYSVATSKSIPLLVREINLCESGIQHISRAPPYFVKWFPLYSDGVIRINRSGQPDALISPLTIGGSIDELPSIISKERGLLANPYAWDFFVKSEFLPHIKIWLQDKYPFLQDVWTPPRKKRMTKK